MWQPIFFEDHLLQRYLEKTHANMGNLFGWIYGEQPQEFKKATWETYLLFSKETWDGEDE